MRRRIVTLSQKRLLSLLPKDAIEARPSPCCPKPSFYPVLSVPDCTPPGQAQRSRWPVPETGPALSGLALGPSHKVLINAERVFPPPRCFQRAHETRAFLRVFKKESRHGVCELFRRHFVPVSQVRISVELRPHALYATLLGICYEMLYIPSPHDSIF